MKKLINAPEDVLVESLKGVALAHPELSVDLENHVITRATPKEQGKVAIVSGGGSGHEPLHGGFVGTGMLDAAVAGEVFTSPTPDRVQVATKAVDRGAGVLHIVKNYTGDVLNFEMAAELASMEGIEVGSITVDDDVAVQDSLYTAGRRGVGLTVLLEKIVGAAAEEGRDLAAVVELAKRVNGQGRSMGMALTSCTVPAAGKPTFDLPDDQMEIGIGIHGEPGRHREPLAPASDIARQLVEPILSDLDAAGPAIVMLNGMGATPLIELYLMYGEVAAILEKSGVQIARNLVGNYITSLDMAGCSVTVLKADDELLRLWDAPVNTPACGGARDGGRRHRRPRRLGDALRDRRHRQARLAHRTRLGDRRRGSRSQHGQGHECRRGEAGRGDACHGR
ncbi:dihydroxyacetone kinase subunit DhaK [Microbacterium sp. Se63.02b]|nr:dihydroxyacetone kinase subunit DhaK [Microbacterium sp. Se63.02b]